MLFNWIFVYYSIDNYSWKIIVHPFRVRMLLTVCYIYIYIYIYDHMITLGFGFYLRDIEN